LNHCLVSQVSPVTGAHNLFESRVDAPPSGIPQPFSRHAKCEESSGIIPRGQEKAANSSGLRHREPAGGIEAQKFLGRNESCHRLSALLSMLV
jgi:hypothetical protein